MLIRGTTYFRWLYGRLNFYDKYENDKYDKNSVDIQKVIQSDYLNLLKDKLLKLVKLGSGDNVTEWHIYEEIVAIQKTINDESEDYRKYLFEGIRLQIKQGGLENISNAIKRYQEYQIKYKKQLEERDAIHRDTLAWAGHEANKEHDSSRHTLHLRGRMK